MTLLSSECPRHVLGLDLSLTSTGVVWVQPGHSPVLDLIRTKGAQVETLAERASRQDFILDVLKDYFSEIPPGSLVLVEGPAYSSSHGKAWDRAGLWWHIVHVAMKKYDVVIVPPNNRAMYGTGRGRAGKDQVISSIVKRYSDVEIADNNLADAFILAAMGCRALGYPLEETLPQAHLRAMLKIDWSVLGENYRGKE